jgi:hypothetical protein
VKACSICGRAIASGSRCAKHPIGGKATDGDHRRLRKAIAELIASGMVVRCVRCRLPIRRGDEWHLDHSPDRRRWLGPSHRLCNERAGAAVTNGGVQ